MKKVIGLFLLSLTGLLAGETVRTGIAPFQISKKKKKTADAIVSEISSAFSKYKFIRLVDRSKMDALFQEVILKQQGIIDEETAVKEGKVLGLQILVVGVIHAQKISARAIHMQTQKVISAHTVSSLGHSRQLALYLLRGIETYLAREKLKKLRNDSPDIQLKFWVEANGKKVHKQTKIGRKAVFKFSSNRRGYLTIVDIQPGGNVVILFPNEFSNSSKIAAGKVYSVPGEDDEFEITVTEPSGVDTLVAFFTKKKVPWLDHKKLEGQGFWTVKNGMKLEMARGFAVTATKLKKKDWESKTIEVEVIR